MSSEGNPPPIPRISQVRGRGRFLGRVQVRVRVRVRVRVCEGDIAGVSSKGNAPSISRISRVRGRSRVYTDTVVWGITTIDFYVSPPIHPNISPICPSIPCTGIYIPSNGYRSWQGVGAKLIGQQHQPLWLGNPNIAIDRDVGASSHLAHRRRQSFR